MAGAKDSDYYRGEVQKNKVTYYILVRGPSYGTLDFDDREAIRTDIRERLESNGIRFVEYQWVWDEDDRCLLVVGRYEKREDAYWWIRALESKGFEIITRTSLPGEG